jgi:hypothetical protein
MIELHDWYNSRGQNRGPGFLVHAIRNPQSIGRPHGFASSHEAAARRESEATRKRIERHRARQRDAKLREAEEARDRPFVDYWSRLSEDEQQAFAAEAVRQADATKRDGYYRSMGRNDALFEQYRKVILRDHFERTHAANATNREIADGDGLPEAPGRLDPHHNDESIDSGEYQDGLRIQIAEATHEEEERQFVHRRPH